MTISRARLIAEVEALEKAAGINQPPILIAKIRTLAEDQAFDKDLAEAERKWPGRVYSLRIRLHGWEQR